MKKRPWETPLRKPAAAAPPSPRGPHVLAPSDAGPARASIRHSRPRARPPIGSGTAGTPTEARAGEPTWWTLLGLTQEAGPAARRPRAGPGDAVAREAGWPQRGSPTRLHARDSLERSGVEEQTGGRAGGRRAGTRSLGDVRWPSPRGPRTPGPRGAEVCGPGRDSTCDRSRPTDRFPGTGGSARVPSNAGLKIHALTQGAAATAA